MEQIKTSVFANVLIWFGAAVSIAEILTGTFIAPLGFGKGIAAILLGHVIGCVLLYLAGMIGAQSERSAMETVKISFGKKGSVLFSSLNVLQLVGWTAVMIAAGATAANSILRMGGDWVWSLIIGVLIIVWIMIGLKSLGKINAIAMSGLFILTIAMSMIVFRGDISTISQEGLSFGAAVELSVAMPLSWLPLISDYTRTAKKKQMATLASSITYFVMSCWMYVIGLGAALFTGESDIAKIMLSAGLSIAGLIVIVLSTVTTTFLDAYSAGVSLVSISKKINEKAAAVAVCVIGTVLSMLYPVSQFENFLYFIGSVFAPMVAILITDYFILKKDSTELNFDGGNLVIWLVGFVLYRVFMRIDTPVGNTLPVMIIISIICIVVNKMIGGKKHVC
jgi:putative hydroxymethylpyrimidine transporter CytX